MSAHRAKAALITPDRIAWFAAYQEREPAWGEFHVALADGNYGCGAGPHHPVAAVTAAIRATWPDDLRDAAEWFDLLTPSQRRRLAMRVAKYRERWVAIIDADEKLMTHWIRWNGYGTLKVTATVTGTAKWLVVRNGLGRELRRSAVT